MTMQRTQRWRLAAAVALAALASASSTESRAAAADKFRTIDLGATPAERFPTVSLGAPGSDSNGSSGDGGIVQIGPGPNPPGSANPNGQRPYDPGQVRGPLPDSMYPPADADLATWCRSQRRDEVPTWPVILYGQLVHPDCAALTAQNAPPAGGTSGGANDPIVIVVQNQPAPVFVPTPQGGSGFGSAVANAANAAAAGVNGGGEVVPDPVALTARRNDAAHEARIQQQARGVAALLQARQARPTRPAAGRESPYAEVLGTWVGEAVCGVSEIEMVAHGDGVAIRGLEEGIDTPLQFEEQAAVAYAVPLVGGETLDVAFALQGEALRMFGGQENRVVCQGAFLRPGRTGEAS